MKKISFRLIFAALAATTVLAGCVQEITPPNFENDKVNPAAEGTRVIAVSFAPQTKTYLDKDGLQPRFADGDSILISNGNALDTCEVKDETISTNLLGPLKAVYPYKAAKMNDKNQIDTVFVSSEQDGTFASANICMARMTDENEESLSFENKTAVLRFYVGNEIGVTSVSVKSESEKFSPTIGFEITVKAPTGRTLYEQMPDNQDRRVCYIAVPYGTFSKLTITTTANTQTPELKQLTDVTFDTNNIYTVFIPYYIQVGDQKWAYCNIGAFLPEEPGLYFAWGETTGHKAGDSYLFNSANYKASGASVNITPNSGYDAARVNWHGAWRMPTIDEFNSLISSTKTTSENVTSGVLTINGSSLKIPSGGWVENDKRSYPGSGYLWSSTINSGDTDYAIVFGFSDSSISTSGGKIRHFGLNVRPIYVPDPEPENDPDILPGEFSVDINKKVKFTKGNLYWDGSSYRFESNQYDYRQFNGIQGDAAVIRGISGTTPENTVGTFWWVPNHLVESTEPYSEAPASNLGSKDYDIIFTNSDRTTANPEFTVNGKSGKYRTFTAGEMAAILFDRTDECRFAKAQVMGVNGLFIFPDHYSLPSGYSTEGGVGMSAINDKTIPFPETDVPDDTWTKMESEGVVFLPAAGYRTSYLFPSINVIGSGIGGYYWTNSHHGTSFSYEDATAGFMEFTEENINQNANGYRKTGYSVRLVKDVVFY